MSVSTHINVSTSVLARHLRAENLNCGLHDKVLGFSARDGERYWHSILLTDGSGAIETGDDAIPLQAPCLAWVPWRRNRKLRIRAGGVGFMFAVSDEVLADAIGNNSESVNLRNLVDRRVIARLEDEPEMMTDAAHAFDLIVRESHRPRSGSWNMVLSQVRSVMVFLWRLSGIEEVALSAQGEPSRILQRFRQLLEIHFRDRWMVRTYAEALKISHDRLHDICQRELGKTPKQLIHERVLHEACLRLERSALTVEQVANSVGFADVGHFSRFFKSKIGLPPAAYRKTISDTHPDSSDILNSSYADWP